MSILEAIKRNFDCKETDIRTYSPLALAYVGDAVYELAIRTVAVERGNTSVSKLHQRTVRFVNAKVQAQMAAALMERLTEEELAIYRRGRNAKPHNTAKNASPIDYRKATGFEALCGYLYLTGRQERMLSLVREAIERLGLQL